MELLYVPPLAHFYLSDNTIGLVDDLLSQWADCPIRSDFANTLGLRSGYLARAMLCPLSCFSACTASSSFTACHKTCCIGRMIIRALRLRLRVARGHHERHSCHGRIAKTEVQLDINPLWHLHPPPTVSLGISVAELVCRSRALLSLLARAFNWRNTACIRR